MHHMLGTPTLRLESKWTMAI